MIVELARTIDGPELRALLGGTLDGRRVLVDSIDARAVLHVLETWSANHALPLVPVRVDEHTFALAPPAG
jgi:hypothetical protein